MLSKLKPKSEFSKNVLTLMTGTTIAQAIPIAISPILTRIYTPEDFGVFALFIAITTIFGTIANGRYELAIMHPKKDEDAINIFALGFIITCVISLLLLFLVIVFNDYFTRFFGNNDISYWLYFIPLSVFFIGLFNILNYFNNRRKKYHDLRNATILKSILLVLIQIIVGFIKAGASGLIFGSIISNMFANMKLLKNIIKDKVLVSNISKLKIIALMKKYREFPKYNLMSNLSNMITIQLPFFLIPKIFDISISGYFFFAQKIISLPSSLIATSISQVFFQKTSENYKNKIKNMPIFLITLKKLTIVALPISIFMYIFSPMLFELIFGKEWRLSGEISQYLAIIFFFNFIISTLSIILISYKKLKLLAIWQYIYLFTAIVLYVVSYYFGLELTDFLLLYVSHQILLYVLYFYMIYQVVSEIDKSLGGRDYEKNNYINN